MKTQRTLFDNPKKKKKENYSDYSIERFKFNVGDKVSFTTEGKSYTGKIKECIAGDSENNENKYEIIVSKNAFPFTIFESDLTLVNPGPPRPFKAGEKVIYDIEGKDLTGTIISIKGPMAKIKTKENMVEIREIPLNELAHANPITPAHTQTTARVRLKESRADLKMVLDEIHSRKKSGLKYDFLLPEKEHYEREIDYWTGYLTPGRTNNPKTTGPVTYKKYRCLACKQAGRKTIKSFSTNHYGNIYNTPCPTGFHPFGNKAYENVNGEWECVEKMPKGWDRPTPWTRVRLGDIVEIKKIKNPDQKFELYDTVKVISGPYADLIGEIVDTDLKQDDLSRTRKLITWYKIVGDDINDDKDENWFSENELELVTDNPVRKGRPGPGMALWTIGTLDKCVVLAVKNGKAINYEFRGSNNVKVYATADKKGIIITPVRVPK